MTISLFLGFRRPVLVFWSGNTDKTLINGLKIRNLNLILNITAYSDTNDNKFNLKLVIMDKEKQLYNGYIGN
jgi:hypothetical protein